MTTSLPARCGATRLAVGVGKRAPAAAPKAAKTRTGCLHEPGAPPTLARGRAPQPHARTPKKPPGQCPCAPAPRLIVHRPRKSFDFGLVESQIICAPQRYARSRLPRSQTRLPSGPALAGGHAGRPTLSRLLRPLRNIQYPSNPSIAAVIGRRCSRAGESYELCRRSSSRAAHTSPWLHSPATLLSSINIASSNPVPRPSPSPEFPM
jgi:hypothetical protein